MTLLEYYIHILRLVNSNKPAAKPMWTVDGIASYGDDNYDLAKTLTTMAYKDETTPEPTFELLKTKVCASRIVMKPSGIEFVIYNEKAT